MANTYEITEKVEGRGGSAKGGENKQNVPVGFKRTFQVISSGINDNIKDILGAQGSPLSIPYMWEQHPEDPLSLLMTKDATQNDLRTWTVVCAYENQMMQGGSSDGTEIYPWKMPAEISFGTDSTAIVAEFSYKVTSAGKVYPFDDNVTDERGLPSTAIMNSAKMPYDPPLMRERNLLSIMITRNVQDTDPNNIVKFKDTGNLTALRVAGVDIGVYKGYMKEYTAVKKWFTGVPGASKSPERGAYFQEHFQIVVNPDTWVRKILDCGLYEYKYSGGDWGLYEIKDKSTPPKAVTQPVPLYVDGSGQALQMNIDPVTGLPAPNYLNHKLYYPVDWTSLTLPKEKLETSRFPNPGAL